MNAAEISRQTTIGPTEAQHYLAGGLDADMILGLYGMAKIHAVPMAQVVERLFSWHPVDGFRVRPGVEATLRSGIV